MSWEASIWRVQDMPKREVAGSSAVAGRRSVKYEKSSVELREADGQSRTGHMRSAVPWIMARNHLMP